MAFDFQSEKSCNLYFISPFHVYYRLANIINHHINEYDYIIDNIRMYSLFNQLIFLLQVGKYSYSCKEERLSLDIEKSAQGHLIEDAFVDNNFKYNSWSPETVFFSIATLNLLSLGRRRYSHFKKYCLFHKTEYNHI